MISIELLSLVQNLDVKIERHKHETDSLVRKVESVEQKLSQIISELEYYKKPWYSRWFRWWK